MSKIEDITINTSELANLFGVSDKYISQLVLDHGMPKVAHNKFNLVTCIKWRLDHIEKIHLEEKNKIREQNSKARLETASAQLKELELAERRRELIKSDEVYQSKMNDAIIYVKGLEALETKLPPVLVHLTTEEEIANLIKTETNNIRNQIAKQPGAAVADDVEFN